MILERHIWQEIALRDTNRTLTHDEINEMASDLAKFVIQSTEKYIKGKAEHGGHIADRDLLLELLAENIDTHWYICAEMRKRAAGKN